MNISLKIESEGNCLEYIGNWFTGSESLSVDGKTIIVRNKKENYFRYQRDEFSVGIENKHHVLFEKEKPIFFVTLQPPTYRIFVDGKLVFEKIGF
jgi:hypothetical protein